MFNQPISMSKNGEYRIAIKCNTNGDFHAVLTVYQANNEKYEKLFSCPAVIGKNGPGKQSEGDNKTPLGTWIIGNAYGIAENPESKVKFTRITDDMYWCTTGSNEKKYNTLIYKSDCPNNNYSKDEHLIDYPIRYKYLLDIGYNKACAPYAGSAIFLHCWKTPETPTGGCVAISVENMVKVLKTITPGTLVTIY